jgi:hypothetical protein
VLYLEAKTQIIGMHPNRGRFAQTLARRAPDLDREGSFHNIGVWEFVGLTGAWSRVLALYEMTEAWSTVGDLIRQTMQSPTPELAGVYAVADSMRSGGVDEVMEPLPGSPSLTELTSSGVLGPLLVADETLVARGEEEAYAERLMADWAPVAAGHHHRLVGLYRRTLSDGPVVAYWATDVDAYRRLMESGRVRQWQDDPRNRRRVSWRQELWTATPGSRFATSAV